MGPLQLDIVSWGVVFQKNLLLNIHHDVEVEVVCKEVTSKHCPTGPAHVVVNKREAEADPEADPLFYHHAAAVAPAAAIVAAPAARVTTVKHACQEVTTKHCVNNPKKVTKSLSFGEVPC